MFLIVFGSKFYALSHAFDGISKIFPVSPKMADMWGPVGCILGVRLIKAFEHLMVYCIEKLTIFPSHEYLVDFDELLEYTQRVIT